jgi:hypothetical protein
VDNSNAPFVPRVAWLPPRSASSTASAGAAPPAADAAAADAHASRLRGHVASLGLDRRAGSRGAASHATYPHPLAAELAALPTQYPAWQLESAEPQPPKVLPALMAFVGLWMPEPGAS